MKIKGIRISDGDIILNADLPDILSEIDDGQSFYWVILYLYANADWKKGKSLPISEDVINKSETGLPITCKELNHIAKEFYQIIDITIIGCLNKNSLCHFDTDQEMYETSDIVIEMIDGSFWQIFSKIFNEKVNKSARGLSINWKELKSLSRNISHALEILIIGSNSKTSLRRYEKDQEMYETCEIVIEMIDSGFWEIFSKDEQLLQKFATKFKDVEYLESDFQKKYE